MNLETVKSLKIDFWKTTSNSKRWNLWLLKWCKNSLKKYNVGNFLETWILGSNPVTLLNDFMIYLFLATFQNTNTKSFAWIPFLLRSDILEKRMFSISFSKFENILSFLSNFKKVFVVKVFVTYQAVNCSCATLFKKSPLQVFLILKCLHKSICDGV